MTALEKLLSEILFDSGLMLSVRIVGQSGCWAGYPHWEHADEDFIFPAANRRR